MKSNFDFTLAKERHAKTKCIDPVFQAISTTDKSLQKIGNAH